MSERTRSDVHPPISSSCRLAHVYYCLACTLAVLNDRHCAISLYEMQVSVPSQEFLYEAKSEAEWGRLFATMDPPSTPCFSILMDLILSGLSDLSQMPKGLLGNFAVIVGTYYCQSVTNICCETNSIK